MIPWKLLSRSSTPDKKSGLTLYQRGTEYSIRVNGQELMNSRMFGSEKILAELSCPPIADRKTASVLIGGLGMGYTLSAALRLLHSDADVLVAELVPSVVEWNKNVFGSLAGDPLRDSRVTVVVEDVINIINDNTSAFDAILLDVDNGPASLTQKKNVELYSMSGLSKIHRALRPGGVAAVWSSSPDKGFMRRLKRSFFHVLEKKVRGRTPKKGPVHTIWIATKSKEESRSRSEFLREAARAYIQRKRRWADIFSMGRMIAKDRGFLPEDVSSEIETYRKEKASRK